MRTHPRAHAIAGLMTIGLLTAGAPARAQTDQGIGGTGAPAKSALARDEKTSAISQPGSSFSMAAISRAAASRILRSASR